MDWQDVFDRFYFEKDRILDDDIGATGAIKTDAFVNQWQPGLSRESQTSTREFEPVRKSVCGA